MTTLTESVEVGAPIDEAFALVADFSRLAEWDPNVATSRVVSGRALEKGARLAVGVRFIGRIVPLEYELTAIAPPAIVTYIGRGKTVTSTDTVEFAPVGTGTRIGFRADVEFRSWGRLLGPLVSFISRRQARAALARLKAILG